VIKLVKTKTGCEFCQRALHILHLDRPSQTDPRRVGSNNPDCVVGLISAIRLDLTFDRISWSKPVFRGPLGTLDPDTPNKDAWTPLSYAAVFGHEGVVKILLERGDINSDSSNKYGRTPLSYAAEYGQEGIVKILLEQRDVNLNSSDKFRGTPLSYATASGHEGVVKIPLGRADVNLDSLDVFGQGLLSRAAGSGHEGIMKIL